MDAVKRKPLAKRGRRRGEVWPGRGDLSKRPEAVEHRVRIEVPEPGGLRLGADIAVDGRYVSAQCRQLAGVEHEDITQQRVVRVRALLTSYRRRVLVRPDRADYPDADEGGRRGSACGRVNGDRLAGGLTDRPYELRILQHLCT